MGNSIWEAVILIVLVIWFLLLPAGAIKRLRDRESESTEERKRSREAEWAIAGLILAIAVGSAGYKLLVRGHLEQTAALFIGLPALLAILTVLLTKPKSATGMACKGMAIALLVSGIFLGEGFVCILMAAPLFFGMAVVVGGVIDAMHRAKKSSTTMTCLLVLGLIPMSLEGVRPALSFPREQAVTVERVVPLSADQVERNLASTSEFKGKLPPYLRLGFPRPAATSGQGLGVGDRRVIHFAGGEGKPGDLMIEVAESSPGRVLFRMNGDSSHIAHWLTWESADVSWHEEGPGRTRVRWTIGYRRSLDPAWYFGPWEHYAVRLAGGYLIDNLVIGDANGH
jgi:hypothetical protein